MRVFSFRRISIFAITGLAAALAYSQDRDSRLRPDHAAHLEVVVQRADTGEEVPARVYLFRSERRFRFSPVDSLLSMLQDNFYRNRVWRMTDEPKTLEVKIRDMSHLILREGRATFDVPAWPDYRIEAYHGLFYSPDVEHFSLEPDERKTIVLEVEPMAPERRQEWIAADDHVHLMRAPEDDELFLDWMEAEDLDVLNNLEGQRQQHFGVQYAFGPEGEAKRPGMSIRSGHETRSDFYGHVLVFGGRELIRPLGIGDMYGNSPEAYPYPTITFRQGRKAGGLVGYAHFHGSRRHSQLIMNLALNEMDFVEVMQYAKIWVPEWYQLLNAGFRVTGTAGCDFPDPTDHFHPWPRDLPLLGPERTLVKAEPGPSAWETWAEGVRRGATVVTNGPLLDFTVDEKQPGAIVSWEGDSKRIEGTATAVFHRPIESVEIVVNGEVAAQKLGDGSRKEISLPFSVSLEESSWISARTESSRLQDDIPIWAHTSPAYFLKDGKPVYKKADREAVRLRWEEEVEFYRKGGLVFAEESQREDLLRLAEKVSDLLEGPQPPWPKR